MKIVCSGQDLSDAVMTVSKALSNKTTNPVLEGIKLSAYGDTLTLLATDTDLSIEKSIKAEVFMEGETVVVGKYFMEFVKKLEGESIELSRLDEGPLKINYGDSDSEFQVFPAEAFPVINKEKEGNIIFTKEGVIKKAVEKCVFSCSSDDSRPVLKGCLFNVENNELTCVALDGYRMAVYKEKVSSSGNFKAIIPARTLSEISRILNDDEKEIQIFLQQNSLFVEVDDTCLVSRLIAGEYIRYEQIIPASFENVVTVNKAALLTSIERAYVVSKNDRLNIIALDVKEDKMNVSSRSEIGYVNENVNCLLEGKDIKIAFNGKFLSDYLRAMDAEMINLKLNTPITPCVMQGVEDESLTYLLLPVKLGS